MVEACRGGQQRAYIGRRGIGRATVQETRGGRPRVGLPHARSGGYTGPAAVGDGWRSPMDVQASGIGCTGLWRRWVRESRVERRGCGLSVEAKWEWAGRSLRARRRPGGTCRSSLSHLGRDWPHPCSARPAHCRNSAGSLFHRSPPSRLPSSIEPHPSPKTSHERVTGRHQTLSV